MRKIYFFVVCLLLIAGATYARDGVDLMLKGGLVDNYSQSGLNLPTYDIESLSLMGGQFRISKLPVVDLILGADYSWRDRDYQVDDHLLNFRVRDLAITASVVYPFEISNFEFYAGAGVGSHSISYEYRRPRELVLEDYGIEIPGTSPFLGYHALLGGKSMVVSDMVGLFVEMRLYRIDAPYNDISYNSWTAGILLSLE